MQTVDWGKHSFHSQFLIHWCDFVVQVVLSGSRDTSPCHVLLCSVFWHYRGFACNCVRSTITGLWIWKQVCGQIWDRGWRFGRNVRSCDGRSCRMNCWVLISAQYDAECWTVRSVNLCLGTCWLISVLPRTTKHCCRITALLLVDKRVTWCGTIQCPAWKHWTSIWNNNSNR
jgi:hypothetical protein